MTDEPIDIDAEAWALTGSKFLDAAGVNLLAKSLGMDYLDLRLLAIIAEFNFCRREDLVRYSRSDRGIYGLLSIAIAPWSLTESQAIAKVDSLLERKLAGPLTPEMRTFIDDMYATNVRRGCDGGQISPEVSEECWTIYPWGAAAYMLCYGRFVTIHGDRTTDDTTGEETITSPRPTISDVFGYCPPPNHPELVTLPGFERVSGSGGHWWNLYPRSLSWKFIRRFV
jgi:hypothetical protein